MDLNDNNNSELPVSSSGSEEQTNETMRLTDELLIAAVDELTLDAEDIQKASAESLCLDKATSESIAAFANTAVQMKEIIHQTLKCRQEQPEEVIVISPGEAGIREKLADLEKVIQRNGCVEKSKDADCINNSEETGLPQARESSEIDIHTEKPSHHLASENNCCGCHGTEVHEEITMTKEEPVIIDPKNDKPECDTENITNLTIDPSAAELQKTNPQTIMTKPAAVVSSLPEEKVVKPNQKQKKGEKTAEQVMKSLSHCQSVEEKLRLLCRKHSESLEELRSQELRLRQGDRLVVQVSREKEQLQAEHNRTVLGRSRLEGLCRELQRQNKVIKEESLLRIREEEEKRKDISSKFQATLNDITTLLQDNKQRDGQLREENLQLANKLKALVDHYDTWEKHMEKVVQQKELEFQLSKAKLGKALLQQQGEREQSLREKHQLLENMSGMQKKGAQLAKTELQLRTELALYTAKYEEFQGVLSKSNQVFATFKVDMEKMSKKIKALEKETIQWKSKWENSNRALIEMAADKQKRDQELVMSNQRIATLEKLCRALQAERNDLRNKLKSGNEPCNLTSILPEGETITSDLLNIEVLATETPVLATETTPSG